MVGDWYLITMEALQDLWQGFLNFLPALIGAIVVFVIGWFFSIGVGRLVTEVLKKIGFSRVFEKGVWKEALEKAEFKMDAAGFVGAIFKWVLVIVFLLAAVEILGFKQFADFVKTDILGYLGDVIIAVLIFVVAVIIADLLEKIVRAAVESARVGYGNLVGVIVKWSIWIFAFLMILIQLRVTPDLIQTLFTGFVALIVIGGGLAFGLGGKEIAGEILKDLYKKLKG